MMSEEKKTKVEEAKEKDCIILIAALIIKGANGNAKCRGPSCAQYSTFTNTCGLM